MSNMVWSRQNVLSDELRALLTEYYQLANSAVLTEKDTDRIVQIWDLAETNDKLLSWLELIDNFLTNQATTQKSFADDENSRAFLSEHWEGIVAERSQLLRGSCPQQASHNSQTVLICPDGSGYVALVVDSGKPRPLGQQECSRCHKPLSEHIPVLVSIGGDR